MVVPIPSRRATLRTPPSKTTSPVAASRLANRIASSYCAFAIAMVRTVGPTAAFDGDRAPSVERDDQHHREVVGRAGVGERRRRVSGRGDDQRAALVLREPAEDGERLEVFKGTGRVGRAAFRPPAVEGDPQIGEAEPGGEGLAAVDPRPGHGRDRPPQREPLPVAEDRGLGADDESVLGVLAAEQRRRVVVGALEPETVVVRERRAATRTPERILRYRLPAGRIPVGEGSHLYRFGVSASGR